MLNSAFNAFTNVRTDYYPRKPARRDRPLQRPRFIRTSTTAFIAPVSRRRRRPMNRRFATSSIRSMRSSKILSQHRYLVGNTITEADWRLFCTLIRFDAVYYSHFKCNWRHIYEYPEPVKLSARSLSGAWRGRDREHRADQAALLQQPASGEPDRYRSRRAATRLRRAARPRAIRLRLTTTR